MKRMLDSCVGNQQHKLSQLQFYTLCRNRAAQDLWLYGWQKITSYAAKGLTHFIIIHWTNV